MSSSKTSLEPAEFLALETPCSEARFADLVEALAADEQRRCQLPDLLREDHPVYDGRGAGTVVRMRGWVLVALARHPLPETALLFVLEELDTGTDPYLVAAAARALRASDAPRAAFASFLLRAFGNIRYREENVSFTAYGESAVAAGETSPLREVLAGLGWLGPLAAPVAAELKELCRNGLPPKLRAGVERVLEQIGGSSGAVATAPLAASLCCDLPGGLGAILTWARRSRASTATVEKVVFEDQDGATFSFEEFFLGQPSIVAFFYTRCDNPLKCSLTVAKLARMQQILAQKGLARKIRSAAITYDPAFDRPEWLRQYGQNRGLRCDPHHRLLRSVDGLEAIRRHFALGVNFVESLVNRHRLEVFVLDAAGRTAATFSRIHWNENEVVDQAIQLLGETRSLVATSLAAAKAAPPQSGLFGSGPIQEPQPPPDAVTRIVADSVAGTIASLGLALFPKCPICWAAYLSMLGIAGLQSIPHYATWLQPCFALLLMIHLASVLIRGKAAGRYAGVGLSSAGALAIAAGLAGLPWPGLPGWGVAFTLAGSLLSVFETARPINLGNVESR